jgi:1-acyl-sn-glycerol-3-phosphate acyltransferase
VPLHHTGSGSFVFQVFIVYNWQESPPFFSEVTLIRWYYYISRWGVIIFYKILIRWRVEGIENVPANGPVLMVSNHLSNADPPLLSVTLKRNALFMAKKELFKNPLLGYLLYGLGAFPVHRGQLDRKALRHAESVLADNKILCMFPEASRSKNARLKEAYPGSALIATRYKAPIVPVAITGTEKIVGLKWIFYRYPVLVRFGKPFQLPLQGEKRKHKDLEESTRVIMEHIAAILPEEYRGVYATRESDNDTTG